MATDNPILDRDFVVAGQTRQLTCTETPSAEKPKKVPPAVQKLISELGFRYRPTSQTDLEAHAAALALLAVDLIDMPPHLLAKAISKHVMECPYLPKASDLVRLAKGFIPERPSLGAVGETQAQRSNRLMDADQNGRRDIRWFDNPGGGAHLELIA